MSTYILWDIDGTLVQNTPNGGVLYLDAIEQVTGTRPTQPVAEPHGMTEGQLLAAILETNGLDGSRLGEVLYQLDVLSREQHERGHVRDACAGVEAAVDAMANRGWTNALLTGNGPHRARYKLLAAGIDPELFDWDHSYFGHQAPTRHHLTAGARAALAGHSSVIIGDTPNDGLAADSAGIPFVAVATGIYPSEVLVRTSALVVVDDLESGLDDVLQAIEQATATEESAPEGVSEAADPEEEPHAEAAEPEDAEPEAAEPEEAGAEDEPAEPQAEAEPAEPAEAKAERAESN